MPIGGESMINNQIIIIYLVMLIFGGFVLIQFYSIEKRLSLMLKAHKINIKLWEKTIKEK